MIALQFGAGNIGRGFIGALLNQANYEIYFLDVNENLISELNKRGSYIIELASEKKETITVTGVKGINSAKQTDKVIDLICQADLITTAVGPNILKIIAPTIASGLKERFKQSVQPLNIIACENMIGGSQLLKEEVDKSLTDEEKQKLDQYVGFPNAAVDRIVPLQTHEDPLKVSVEPFFEWVVEKTDIKGSLPNIQGITYVDDLNPYIERKLFTVNTGHATAAYLGYFKNIETIDKAVLDPFVRPILEGALAETGDMLAKTYHFDRSEHQKYIDKILSRFENKQISDNVTRVARSPIRKLGANDRLILPAKRLMEFGQKPENLATAVAAALLFDYKEDQEAVELQEIIKTKGAAAALKQYSQLDENDPLTKLILEKYEQLIKLK
ncbi:mannitol-1-phosphate 5-dehydrogenase [Aeribacillus sp. FSL M8-0235]|uniref:mannitol-1-phosphate 5-dehydrogenase n=1 Tax=Aeribacillus sp. FSL M8-0235 TaxID=2954576 RepID=UPI0030F79EAB